MSPGPIQLDQATALTLMLGPNGSVGIQASGKRVDDDRVVREPRRVEVFHQASDEECDQQYLTLVPGG